MRPGGPSYRFARSERARHAPTAASAVADSLRVALQSFLCQLASNRQRLLVAGIFWWCNISRGQTVVTGDLSSCATSPTSRSLCKRGTGVRAHLSPPSISSVGGASTVLWTSRPRGKRATGAPNPYTTSPCSSFSMAGMVVTILAKKSVLQFMPKLIHYTNGLRPIPPPCLTCGSEGSGVLAGISW